MRLGIAGLGAVAQAVYLPLLARHPERFGVAAVADLSPVLVTAIGDRLGLPRSARFESAEELLAGADIDAVLLLASGSHGALAEAALSRGVPVLCEKPLSWTLEEADRLAALPAAERLLLGYMKLYDPAVDRAAELARGRSELRSVEVTVLHPSSDAQLVHAALVPPADVPAEAARARAAEADALLRRALGPAAAALGRLYSDVLLGSVVHDLAVMRVLAGDPESIDHVDTWPHDVETESVRPGSVAVAGRLTGGARFSIRWHFLAAYPVYREEIRLHHEVGTIELAFPSPYLLHAPTELSVSEAAGAASARTRFRSTEEAFERQLFAFHALWRRQERPRAGIVEGRTDIATCQRIAVALARGRGLEVGGEAGSLARAGRSGADA